MNHLSAVGLGKLIRARSVNERTRALVHRRIPHDFVLSRRSIANGHCVDEGEQLGLVWVVRGIVILSYRV